MDKSNTIAQEEMFSLVEKWKESTVSQKSFCRTENVSFYKFYYWLKKYNLQNESSSSKELIGKGFIPINTFSPPAPKVVSILKLSYPNGVVVECSNELSVSRIESLIKLY
ncbi:MAG: hypothetical protein QNK36_07110 [Colwellia sp.]|nr:hypothetical protein [Colwellia sp.]